MLSAIIIDNLFLLKKMATTCLISREREFLIAALHTKDFWPRTNRLACTQI